MSPDSWSRFKDYLLVEPTMGFQMDISKMNFPHHFLMEMEPRIQQAYDSMKSLDHGTIANPDENRMVGHYWLRAPHLAPTPQITKEIVATQKEIIQFARAIHNGTIKPPKASRFQYLLVIGIGGSALGPQFVSQALATQKDKIKVWFFDNTDPDGMDYCLNQIGSSLKQTLTLVISKSGGTKETRNGMLEAKAAYARAGLKFEKHAVAVTGKGSELDEVAEKEQWIRRFPMWDWVGGRTSELSAVGLLPAALQGIDIQEMLRGATEMDIATRSHITRHNPAALLALMWFYAGQGKGLKDMVILPYKDRLQLFSKYLQQLVMESLGKEKDLKSQRVNQGIAVYGNKGSTDQHAYVQQLREGLNNFFVTFIEVLKDRDGKSIQVEPGVTSGDYLNGFFQGTRQALSENGRESITITIDQVSPYAVGQLIALYERAVGLYASLIHINAYHQPGVEAGKKAAGVVIQSQLKIVNFLKDNRGKQFTAEQISQAIGTKDSTETVFKILQHLAANFKDHRVKRSAGKDVFQDTYGFK